MIVRKRFEGVVKLAESVPDVSWFKRRALLWKALAKRQRATIRTQRRALVAQAKAHQLRRLARVQRCDNCQRCDTCQVFDTDREAAEEDHQARLGELLRRSQGRRTGEQHLGSRQLLTICNDLEHKLPR